MSFSTNVRKNLQFKYFSRFSLRRPAIVINSIPKAGTHLAIQILKSAGLIFTGHFPSTNSSELATNHENVNMFSTAHSITWQPGDCKSVLLGRDPVDVVLSMIIYINKRRDHPRHRLFRPLSVTEATSVILDGAGTLEPLLERYINYYRWAQLHNISSVDFCDIRDNPMVLFSKLSLSIEYSPSDLNSAKSKWNPTKRVVKLSDEASIKTEIRQVIQLEYPDIIDVYEDIKSLA